MGHLHELASQTAVPDPPEGAKTTGRELWTEILAAYDLDQHELALLRAMVRTVDELEDLADAVRHDGVIVEGEIHPALREARQLRITLARLSAALRLPSGEEDGRPQRRVGVRGVYNIGGRDA
jgi:hypothetical protein